MSRSWPPPCCTGVSLTDRPTNSAPTPTGPPILWALTAIVASPESAKDSGREPKAWTASEWTGTREAAAKSVISAIPWTVPTSLLAHITLTSATDAESACSSVRSASSDTRPWASTGSHVTRAPSWRSSHSTVSWTAGCSIDEHRMRVRRGSSSRRAQKRPFTARLSASVPPEVKMTSEGWGRPRGRESPGHPPPRAVRGGLRRAVTTDCRYGRVRA